MSTPAPTVSTTNSPTAYRFMYWDIAWMGVLVLLVVGRWRGWGWFEEVDDPVAGVIPLAVPWAGALGGVTVSLMGTAAHTRDCDGRGAAHRSAAEPAPAS